MKVISVDVQRQEAIKTVPGQIEERVRLVEGPKGMAICTFSDGEAFTSDVPNLTLQDFGKFAQATPKGKAKGKAKAKANAKATVVAPAADAIDLAAEAAEDATATEQLAEPVGEKKETKQDILCNYISLKWLGVALGHYDSSCTPV